MKYLWIQLSRYIHCGFINWNASVIGSTEPEYYVTKLSKHMLANILRSGDNGEDCCKNVDFSYETEEYRTLLSLNVMK